MSKRQRNPAAGLASREGEIHPVVSAACFGHYAETTGGSTMNVRTGEVTKPGQPGYIVGGQPDRSGQRVPTEYEPTSSLDRVLQHRQRVASGTNAPQAAVGYWRDTEVPDSPYEVDSSSVFRDRRVAKVVGHRRGEKSVWDLGKMEDIRLDRKGKGKP